ncbi:hypothetical protein V6N11_018645 [Hibiscus sabdariffa]|uniref:Uncharacterized protein n=1 Tax=Hibiscus sabdariffa TaxID=183260 RepID=A0ABR2QSU9_9ROSI
MKEWDSISTQERESSIKRSKTQDSSYYDPPDYVPEPSVVTQSCDGVLDGNERPVMLSRVQTCSFYHKQHAGECPKNPYKNPTTSVSTHFSRNRRHSTKSSSQASKPGK